MKLKKRKSSTQATSTASNLPVPQDQSASSTDIDVTTGSYWQAQDSTSDLSIAEEPRKEAYAASYAALLDKHFFGKEFVPFAFAALVVGGIFLLDNYFARLENLIGLGWTFVKCTGFLILYGGVYGLQKLAKKYSS